MLNRDVNKIQTNKNYDGLFHSVIGESRDFFQVMCNVQLMCTALFFEYQEESDTHALKSFLSDIN